MEIQPRYCFFHERVLSPSFFFMCVVGILQMLKGFLTDDVLNPAGVPFRRFRVYADFNQSVGKEAVLFVDLLRYFPAHIGRMEKVIFVHREKAAVPQGSHCMAHAGL